MSEGTSKSIISLGDFGPAAKILVEKISSGVGGVFLPYQIKRVAKAETEAALIRAQGGIQITELQRRAAHRFVEEEARKQANMESIIAQALPELEQNAEPEQVEDDWITNFFDKCRIVSDQGMQSLWAKVLAGEANSPGSYSKRTINFLGSLDKKDANLFTTLCAFGWFIGGVTPLVFDEQAAIYNKAGINFDALTHLDAIGLVSFNPIAGFVQCKLEQSIKVFYHDVPIFLEFSKSKDNELDVGKALLTNIGQELAKICGSKPVQDFEDYVIERWLTKDIVASSKYPRKK